MGHKSEHVYLVAMLRATQGVPWHRIATLVESVGTAEGLVRGEVAAPNEFTRMVTSAVTDEHLRNAREEVAGWEQRPGMAVWSVLDDDYPADLREIFDKPPFIFCRGNWIDDVDSRGLAVVGTRSATSQGLTNAAEAARQLVAQGLTVISGLALGIDGAAHTAALDSGGRTVAVMGRGLDRIYPRDHEELAERIIERGAALSPFVPTQPPDRRFTFHIRNAVMSGVSSGTLVIEAGPTSGAKMQARLALQHGRPVYLLKTLVDTYEWGREYATLGKYGARATVVDDVDDIINALATPKPIAAGQLSLGLES